eukprot:2608-Amphidinium_carterae.1
MSFSYVTDHGKVNWLQRGSFRTIRKAENSFQVGGPREVESMMANCWVGRRAMRTVPKVVNPAFQISATRA